MKYTWQVAEAQEETPLVKSLYLKATTERPSFIAGQYLTILMPDLGPAEGKAYSISSAPHEENIRITIKKMGTFSSALLALQSADTVITSAPYGFFYPETEDITPLIFIAGGIGITPILSIITDLGHRQDERELHLFYSNQTESDIAFRGELEELAAKNSRLTTHYFITREEPKTTGYTRGRITPTHIVKATSKAESAEYFLCGKMDFTKSLWKDLREHGIKPHQIYTEGFF